MNILGTKLTGHHTGAALISDGEVIAISEERLNREKHTTQFPAQSIAYCLRARNLTPRDIDLVAMDNASHEDQARLGDLFRARTAGTFTNATLVPVNHHLAHAASAFFCSPFEEAAILVYDGAGEVFKTNLGVRARETETLYRGEGETITQMQKMLHAQNSRGQRPHTIGLGLLYDLFSRRYLSFGKHNDGKMMGLAAYGDDSFLKQFPYERWVAAHAGQLVCNADVQFERNIERGGTLKKAVARDVAPGKRGKLVYEAILHRARKYARALSARVASQFVRRWYGGVLTEPALFAPVVMPRPARDPAQHPLPDRYYSAVAYAAQKIFERFSGELGAQLRAVTKSDNLCVAGGCGLNIDANLNFLTEVGFKRIFVQPASSDTGIPLGCALHAAHHLFKMPRFYEMRSASLGRAYTDEEIAGAIDAVRDRITVRRSPAVANEAARSIADGKIIGWFQGGAEYGPRALGNRSILCDARRREMNDVLNNRVKHREPWRPFAASVLAEEMRDWFEIPVESPFMLLAGQVAEEKKKLVPAIVHVDGSCRVQSVTREQNAPYYDLLTAFRAATGVPLVLNTSFNLGGEPIVETPRDALDTFLRTNMDCLVLHDYIIAKA